MGIAAVHAVDVGALDVLEAVDAPEALHPLRVQRLWRVCGPYAGYATALPWRRLSANTTPAPATIAIAPAYTDDGHHRGRSGLGQAALRLDLVVTRGLGERLLATLLRLGLVGLARIRTGAEDLELVEGVVVLDDAVAVGVRVQTDTEDDTGTGRGRLGHAQPQIDGVRLLGLDLGVADVAVVLVLLVEGDVLPHTRLGVLELERQIPVRFLACLVARLLVDEPASRRRRSRRA